MIPASFDYVRATSLAQAIGLLQKDPDGTKLVAGGHTLIPTLKLRLASPALLVDIGGINELKGIEVGDRIRIGALTTHAELLASEPLRKVLPIFHQTADLIADPQVRNRGTIGGSLANADPAADWPAVVLALKAELELAGPTGRRRVATKDFFVDTAQPSPAAYNYTIAADNSETESAQSTAVPLAGPAALTIGAAAADSGGPPSRRPSQSVRRRHAHQDGRSRYRRLHGRTAQPRRGRCLNRRR